jgi:hypothetical protein
LSIIILVVADEACHRAGGTRVTLSINAVRKLDLNGDGRDDYFTKPNASDAHHSSAGPAVAIF